jgi:hypothetical protein
MKKLFLLIALVCAVMATNAQSGTFPPVHNFNNSYLIKPGSLDDILMTGRFLYMGYDNNISRMELADPTNITNVSTLSQYLAAGDFDDNGILYYTTSYYSNSPLYSVDLTTGTSHYIGNLHGADIGSFGTAINMSYYNGKMYSIFSMDPYVYTASAVFEIDLTNGLCTRISSGTFPGFFVSLAINKDGVFYGIDGSQFQNGSLYIINPVAGTSTLVGSTGMNTWTYCDGDFDAATNTLYFPSPYYGISTINLTNGTPTVISPFESYICAVNRSSTGEAVPFSYFWVIIAFSLIAGTIFVRRYFFR